MSQLFCSWTTFEAKQISITTLIPAMQMHLIEVASPTPLFRRFGNHKFQLCMMVLSELRSTYWGADAVYKLFEHAQTRTQKQDTPDINPHKAVTAEEIASPLPQAPASAVFQQSQNDVRDSDLRSFYDPDGIMWDENNPFSIVSDEVRHQFDAPGWGQNNESTNFVDGTNTMLSLQEFNSQCLDMRLT